MTKPKPLLELVGQGALFLGGDGQDLDCLKTDPVALENAPKGGYRKHGFDTYHLTLYEGTDMVQWTGRRADGYFHPYGGIMRLTAAGKRAVKAERKTARAAYLARVAQQQAATV